MTPGDVIYGARPASFCQAPGKRYACGMAAGHAGSEHAWVWWGMGLALGCGGGLVRAVWGGAV